jgi:hypothetical protein
MKYVIYELRFDGVKYDEWWDYDNKLYCSIKAEENERRHI